MNVFPRYERHAELPGFGEDAQKKLFSSKVLIVGLGGLGCPAAIYLAAAGVGHISVADDDCVSLGNLQRQVLYKTSDVGLKKAETAERELKGISPEISVNVINVRMTPENVYDYVRAHDIVLDASDNFLTRYLLNHACLQEGKILVSGAVVYFDGQISVFKAGTDPTQPCYRCLYPIIPEALHTPSCLESAVLGPLPGVIGTMMAVEAIKELTCTGASLAGYALSYSAEQTNVVKMKIAKSAVCPACSPLAFGSQPSDISKNTQVCTR